MRGSGLSVMRSVQVGHLCHLPEETQRDHHDDPGGLLNKAGRKLEHSTLPAFNSEMAARICCREPSVLIPSSCRSPSVRVRKASMSTWGEKGHSGGHSPYCTRTRYDSLLPGLV